MVLIEKIYPRKGGLVSLWSDGEEIALLDKTIAEKNGVREGTTVEVRELMELSEQTADKKAYERGLWLLSQRDYSQKTLTEKIAEKWGKSSAQKAVKRIVEHGYLKDERFALNKAEFYLFERNYSVRKTIYELILKGIDRQTAEEAVDSLEPDETEIALAVIKKKYLNKISEYEDRRKTFAALARLGFNSSDIKCAIDTALNAEDY